MADSDKALKTSIETDASQAIAEQERYNKKLQEMHEQQLAAAQSAKELADQEAYLALKREAAARSAEKAAAAEKANAGAAAAKLHERNVNSLEAAYANQEVAKTVKTVGAEEVKAALASTEATGKAFASKKQLKDILKQIGHELPLLGQIGRLALNPIALAAAGVATAFVIWRKRVTELTEAMAETEHADYKILDAKRVNAVKDEWKKYGEEVDAINEKLHGLAAKHEAAMEKIKAFFELVDQLGGKGPAKDKRETEAELGEISSAAYAAHVSRDAKKREAEKLTAELNAGTAGLDPKVQESHRAALAQRVSDAQADVDKFKAVTKKEPFGLASQARELAEAALKNALPKLKGAQHALEVFDQGGEVAVDKKARIAKLLAESNAEKERFEGLEKEYQLKRDQYRISENTRILNGERPVRFQQSIEHPKYDSFVGVYTGERTPGYGTITTASGKQFGVTPTGNGETLSSRVLPILVQAFKEIDAIRAEEKAELAGVDARSKANTARQQTRR